MSSKECYHFTKLNRIYSIAQKGLVPRLEANSKAVNDSASKISFSDGKMAAVGLFADFCNVYTNMNKKKGEKGYRTPTDKRVLTSKNIEEYLGEGVYLVFDGTDIENTGGNNGNMNKFDSATRTPIRPEELKVCVLRDEKGNIHYSQYDYIKYIIANLTEEDYKALSEIDESGKVLKEIEAYKEANLEEIIQYSQNKYIPELMTLEDFKEKYKTEINADIIKYLQTYLKDSQEEINKLNKEFENMPEPIKAKLKSCQEAYQTMMDDYLNGDLLNLEIPIPKFYDLYRNNLDELITQYCNSIINSSQEEISMLRNEVEGMEEYRDLFLHSNHHIQNVVEFAYIIGKAENTLGDDLELLIQAAKYHDSGREESEWLSDNHADPSAEHADIELSKTGKYTTEQIAMIKVAIRYHEHGEMFKNEFDEEYFMEIAKKEGVPNEKLENTRLMCIYLKDADALDRVRLGNLDVDYLRTSVAKSNTFLREYGKDKEDVQLDKAGLAVRRNMDFDLIEELKKALEKLKQDYADNEIISNGIKKVESEENINSGNIASSIKGVRHILQIEKMVNRVTENTDGIKSSSEKREQYMKLAIERFSKANLDMLELRLKDVIRLSEKPRRDEQENIPVASDIELLEDISVGMNDNKKVKFSDGENTHTGYFKENIVPVFNDTSIAVCKIGKLLDVKMAETFACEYDGKKGIISQDVSEGFDKFVMMRQIIKESELPKIDFSNSERASATKYNPNGMVTSTEKITEMFEFPLQALEKIGVTIDEMQEITRDYVKMICFDYVTNQTDRNDGNYGVLVKDGKVRFAPLIDCDYVLHDPTDTDNDINFTSSVRCDRDVLMSIVASKYPELTQEFSELVIRNKENISKIISESFAPEMQNEYGNIVNMNIDNLQRIVEQTKSKYHDQKSDEFLEDEQGHGKVNDTELSKKRVATMAKREEVVIENENAREAISELERTPEIEKDNSQNLK